MNLRQQIVDGEAEKIAQQLGVTADEGFMRFAHSLIVGQSVLALDISDIVDGGQDKQIDLITIEEEGDSADVYILQTKNNTSFSSNALIQMANGLRWIFERPKKDLSTLSNNAFRDKIHEYRSVQSGVGPANLRIHVAFVTNGSTAEISSEFRQELAAIRDTYSHDVFESFDIRAYGCEELVELLRAESRQSRRIDAELKIRYDTNNPSLIRYYAQDLRGVICTVPAQEIARLVNNDQHGSIFDLNIRRFLGTRGGVNSDILRTCSNPEGSYEFWFLNNGITIVCDSLDAVTDPDDAHIKLKNMQIVNGCQTATTLALAQKNGELAPDVRVMVRIYETSNTNLVDKIVLTTNSQNQISSRDLRANDPVQVDIERACELYGYYYERKTRHFENAGVDIRRILPNEPVGQWYLAIVEKNPADARGRKYKVWGEHYNKVFGAGRVEPYVMAYLIGRSVNEWLRHSGLTNDSDDLRRMLAKRGAFHIGRIVAYLWRGTDDWKRTESELKRQLTDLDSGNVDLEPMIQEAMNLFETLIKSSPDYKQDIDRALKSNALNADIDRMLHLRDSNSHPTEFQPELDL